MWLKPAANWHGGMLAREEPVLTIFPAFISLGRQCVAENFQGMAEMGHKATAGCVQAMTAPTTKADTLIAIALRFVPKADIPPLPQRGQLK
jgi:hypothetical protein